MSRINCPDCGRWLADIGHKGAAADAEISALRSLHTCKHTENTHHPRGNTMTAQPLRPVPATKRPHPRDLTNHPSKAVARAAQKVLDAVAKLDEAWQADAAKAELRAERDALKKQLAKVEAQLRGTTSVQAAPAPARDWKAIRAWAADNDVDCPAVGKVPASVVEAFDAR